MQPISKKNRNIMKGPSTSKEFNEIRNNMYSDLVQLYGIANENEELIKTNMDTLIMENYFMQKRISFLEKELETISKNYEYKQSEEKKARLIKTMYTLDGIKDGDANKEAFMDTAYGYLTIPPAEQISKISYRTDENQVIIPSSLSVDLYESNNVQEIDEETGDYSYYLVEDANIYEMFDKNTNSVWSRHTTFSNDSGATEVYGILHIKLPLDTMNNIYANTLSINPFPEFSLSITDVLYKGRNEQWRRLENYPSYVDNDNVEIPSEIQNAGKTIFSFPKVEMTEIQIKFKQPYWLLNENKREFVYGFQEIELEQRVTESTEVEIVSTFDLEGTSHRFEVIHTPIVEFVSTTETEATHLVEHELYYKEDMQNQFTFGNTILSPIQKVFVKTIIKSENDVIPMIRQINLDYEFKDLTEY